MLLFLAFRIMSNMLAEFIWMCIWLVASSFACQSHSQRKCSTTDKFIPIILTRFAHLPHVYQELIMVRRVKQFLYIWPAQKRVAITFVSKSCFMCVDRYQRQWSLALNIGFHLHKSSSIVIRWLLFSCVYSFSPEQFTCRGTSVSWMDQPTLLIVQ